MNDLWRSRRAARLWRWVLLSSALVGLCASSLQGCESESRAAEPATSQGICEPHLERACPCEGGYGAQRCRQETLTWTECDCVEARPCVDALDCHLRCTGGEDACEEACQAELSAAERAALEDTRQCMDQERCGGVGGSAEEAFGCAERVCVEAFQACLGGAASELVDGGLSPEEVGADCFQTFGCALNCPPPDDETHEACNNACVQAAKPSVVEDLRAMMSCSRDANCRGPDTPQGEGRVLECVAEACADVYARCYEDPPPRPDAGVDAGSPDTEGDCLEATQCLLSCSPLDGADHDACRSGCFEGVGPETRTSINALMDCSRETRCQSLDCLTEACAEPYAACEARSPSAPDAGLDVGVDAGAPDAGPSSDLGPPPDSGALGCSEGFECLTTCPPPRRRATRRAAKAAWARAPQTRASRR